MPSDADITRQRASFRRHLRDTYTCKRSAVSGTTGLKTGIYAVVETNVCRMTVPWRLVKENPFTSTYATQESVSTEESRHAEFPWDANLQIDDQVIVDNRDAYGSVVSTSTYTVTNLMDDLTDSIAIIARVQKQ